MVEGATAAHASGIWELANYGAVGIVAAASLGGLLFASRWALSELRRKDEMLVESIRYITDKHETVVGRVMDGHEKANAAIVGAIDRLAGEVRSTSRS